MADTFLDMAAGSQTHMAAGSHRLFFLGHIVQYLSITIYSMWPNNPL